MLGADSGISRFLAVSDHTAALWRRFGLPAERIGVVHNGVDLDRFRPAGDEERAATRRELGIDPEAIAIGYVGRIDPTKGIEQLLDAFADVATDRLQRRGGSRRARRSEPSPAAAPRRRTPPASSPATGPGVRWLGRRGDPERIVRCFDLLVVPSQWDEPFGLVAIEAMASGVAVIAARRGGFAGDLRRSVPGPAGGADGTGAGDGDSTDDRTARSVAGVGSCQPRARRGAVLPARVQYRKRSAELLGVLQR